MMSHADHGASHTVGLHNFADGTAAPASQKIYHAIKVVELFITHAPLQCSIHLEIITLPSSHKKMARCNRWQRPPIINCATQQAAATPACHPLGNGKGFKQAGAPVAIHCSQQGRFNTSHVKINLTVQHLLFNQMYSTLHNVLMHFVAQLGGCDQSIYEHQNAASKPARLAVPDS